MVAQDLGGRQQAYTMGMANVLSQLEINCKCSCQLVPLAALARFSLQESL